MSREAQSSLLERQFAARRETVGEPDCPLFVRWTLFSWRRRRPESQSTHESKAFVHHFMPDTADLDAPHDHPWPFLTVVLRGGYIDEHFPDPDRAPHHSVRTLLSAPAIAFRPARYVHRTVTESEGAWTVVITGRSNRQWGFWRSGYWYSLKDYERLHGFVKRVCGA